MPERAHAAAAALLDALLPTACAVCGARVASRSASRPRAFCGPCEAALPWWRRVDGCPRCGARADTTNGCPGCLAALSPLHACFASLRYAGVVARWIPAIKRLDSRRAPAAPVLRAIDALADQLASQVERAQGGRIDLVTSLPLHPRRRRERGFNQADAIARPIAVRLGVPFEPTLLERVHDTPPQVALLGRARVDNVRGAFRATRTLPGGLRVALVDDVLTTGASLEAGAEALLRAEALEVRGLTLAATLPGPSPAGRATRRRAS